MEGVVDFVDANDIPGVNGWKPYGVTEEIFSSGKVHYAGQSIGLIIAQTRELAIAAARKVKVTYANQGEVVCDIEKAAETPANIAEAGPALAYGDVAAAIEGADRVVQGIDQSEHSLKLILTNDRTVQYGLSVPFPHGDPDLYRVSHGGWLRY